MTQKAKNRKKTSHGKRVPEQPRRRGYLSTSALRGRGSILGSHAKERRKTAGLPPCLHERSRPIVTRAGPRSGVPAGLHAGGNRLPRRRGPVSTGTASFGNYPERRAGIAYGGGGQHRGVGRPHTHGNTQKTHRKHTGSGARAPAAQRASRSGAARGLPAARGAARPPARAARSLQGRFSPVSVHFGGSTTRAPQFQNGPWGDGPHAARGEGPHTWRRRSPSAPAGAWPGVRALGPGRGARYFE